MATHAASQRSPDTAAAKQPMTDTMMKARIMPRLYATLGPRSAAMAFGSLWMYARKHTAACSIPS